MKDKQLYLHTICIDKSDFRHSKEHGWTPTEHLTKDHFRKIYQQKQQTNIAAK